MGFSLKIRRSETTPPNFYLYFTFVFTIIKKILACGGLVLTLSLPLFLPLLLILCWPCILSLFDLYFTLVFSFILLCVYLGFVSYQALFLTKEPTRSLAAGISSCSRRPGVSVLFLTQHCYLPSSRGVRLPQEPAPAREVAKILRESE